MLFASKAKQFRNNRSNDKSGIAFAPAFYTSTVPSRGTLPFFSS
ncbi:hypothetical protein LEP1GSC047_1928 [Leptospira inadai serovar Lyme str. 10]|uniref:Uncharacterized protein n=1 Tax=Leptospira inadai serovar Lyme str. 10 TaxID=1049790 RepID=V6H7V5_9LEPT|nr:hypothetical protein LEP1GSC047_1928 [Leptospira inadai serovar Lyme str. 10]